MSEITRSISNGFTYTNIAGSGGLPISRIQTISFGHIDFDAVGYASVTSESHSKYLVQPGDILFSHINSKEHVGKVAIYKQDMPPLLHGMNLLRIVANELVLPDFLFWVIRSDAVKSQIYASTRHAVNQASINIRNLQTVLVPVPPIEEQRRIVAGLEKKLAHLDKAFEMLKNTRALNQVLERSIYQKYGQTYFSARDFPILELCEVYQPKTIAVKDLNPLGTYPVYGANGQIGYFDEYNHADAEVTVTCRGATCGTVNVIPAQSWITGNAMVIKPKTEELSKAFLNLFLKGLDFRHVITGTAQPQITRHTLSVVRVPLPSPSEQSTAVNNANLALENLRAVSEQTENAMSKGLEMRRSILNSAFHNV